MVPPSVHTSRYQGALTVKRLATVGVAAPIWVKVSGVSADPKFTPSGDHSTSKSMVGVVPDWAEMSMPIPMALGGDWMGAELPLAPSAADGWMATDIGCPS